VIVAGDGQVTLGNTVVKGGARKVRRLGDGRAIGGFAGSAADGMALFERLEEKLAAQRSPLRRAAGEFPNQHAGGDGLPRWTAADRSITETDVVLWYTFGVTHFVRPEDWPVMPVEYTGFLLSPFGFFDRNPAIDLPPPTCHT